MIDSNGQARPPADRSPVIVSSGKMPNSSRGTGRGEKLQVVNWRRKFAIEDEVLTLRPTGVRFIACCCGLMLALVGSVIWLVYQGVSASLQAETNLHYSHFALQLVERFVTEKGRWPRSWAELKGVEMPDGPFGQEGKAISDELQRRISIDFGVDPFEVARQDRMNFTAIRPNGPYYEYRDYGYVDSLQDAIRKSVSGSKPNSSSGASK
jgi:hypothetical protein